MTIINSEITSPPP